MAARKAKIVRRVICEHSRSGRGADGTDGRRERGGSGGSGGEGVRTARKAVEEREERLVRADHPHRGTDESERAHKWSATRPFCFCKALSWLGLEKMCGRAGKSEMLVTGARTKVNIRDGAAAVP